MIDFEINDKGTLVWNDGSSRPATHQEQELTYEIAYRDDQIKALQAEVERLKAAQQKEGYVLVPVEQPSLAMQQKLWEIVNEFEQTKEAFPAKWCAELLKAAQEPT